MSTMSFEEDDPHLHILQDIEGGLVDIYDADPTLTDASVVFALEIGKVAIKQVHGYAKSQKSTGEPHHQPVIDHIVATGKQRIGTALSLDDYVKCVDKVKRSVERHRSHGLRGYHDFIQQFL